MIELRDIEKISLPEEKPVFKTPEEILREQKKGLELTQDLWNKKALERIDSIGQKWKEDYYTRYGYYPPKINFNDLYPEPEEITMGPMPEIGYPKGVWKEAREDVFALRRYQVKKEKEWHEKKKAYTDFKNYLNEQEKARVEKLTPEQRKMEINFGGIYSGLSRFRLGGDLKFDTFTREFLRGVTSRIVKRENPIYGEWAKEVFPGWAAWGYTFGSMTAYMTFMRLAALAKVPQLFAKLAGVKGGKKLLGATGFLKLWASKLGKTKYMLKTAQDMVPFAQAPTVYESLKIAGAHGLTAGTVGAFMAGIKKTATHLHREDGMSHKEWLASLPLALGEGFLQKYFVGVINDPTSWGYRFLGDAVYATAEQGYRVLKGEQPGYNMEAWANSFIIGHMMGEIQGIAFKPSKDMMNRAYADRRVRAYGNRAAELIKIPFTETEKMELGIHLRQMEYINIEKLRKPFTPAEVDKAIRDLEPVLHNGGYKLMKAREYGDIYDVKLKDWGTITDAGIERTYTALRDNIGLSESEITGIKASGTLTREKIDIEGFKKELGRMGKFERKIIVPKVVIPEFVTPAEKTAWYNKRFQQQLERIGETELKDLLNTVDNEMARHNWIHPKTKRLLSIEDVFINKEQYLRKISDIITLPRKVEKPSPLITPEITAKAEAMRRQFRDFFDTEKDGVKNYAALLKFAKRWVHGWGIKDVMAPEDVLHDAYEKVRSWPDHKMAEITDIPGHIGEVIKNNTRDYFKTVGKATGRQKVLEQMKEAQLDEIKGLTPDDYIKTVIERDGIKNSTYTVLKHLAQKDKVSLRQTMAYYLQKELRYTAREIAELFRSNGIPAQESSVHSWLKFAREDIKNTVVSGELARKRPRLVRKPKYNNDEANEIIRQVRETFTERNPITGLEKTIDPVARKLIEKGNACVISIDSYYDIRNKFNKNTADKVLARAGRNIIEANVEEANTIWYPKERKAKIFIKNPELFSSTKFVLYHQNLDYDEFKQVASRIVNSLKKNFDSINEPEKRFAVLVDMPDGSKSVITDFKNITVSFTKNPDNIFLDNKRYIALKQLARLRDPFTFARMDNSFLVDKSHKTLESIEKLIELTPRSNEEWMRDIDALKEEDIATMDDLVRAVEIDTVGYEATPPQPGIIAADKDARYGDAPLSEGTTQRDISKATRNLNKPTAELGYARVTDEAGRADDPLINEMRKSFIPMGVRNYWNSFKKFLHENFTRWNNMDMATSHIPIIMKTERWGASFDRLGAWAEQDFTAAARKSGVYVTKDRDPVKGVTPEGFKAADVLWKHIIQEEMKTLMDPKDYSIRTPHDVLKKKGISWEKINGVEQKLDLELNRNKSASLTDSFIIQYGQLSNDPLRFSKLLVQYYNFDPAKLYDLMKNLDIFVMKPIQEMFVANLAGADANFNWFARWKGDQQKFIATLIRKFSKDPKARERVDELDLDNPKHYKLAKDLVAAFEDPTVRETGENALRWFKEIDPNKYSYFHQEILSDPNNARQYMGFIKDTMRGKTSRGYEVASGRMKEFQNKSFPSYRAAMEAGYKVERSSFQTLIGALKYAYTKCNNMVFATNMKESFLGKFEVYLEEAIKTGDKSNLIEFARESTGYFYVPEYDINGLDIQIERITKQVKDINQLGAAANTEDVNRRVNLQADISVLQERRARLQNLLWSYQGKTETVKDGIGQGDGLPVKLGLNVEDREAIAEAMVAAEAFVPMNGNSYYKSKWKDLESIQANIATGATKYIEKVSLGEVVKRWKIKRMTGPNLPKWEGIYVSKTLFKGFQHVIFKNDFLNKDYEYDFWATTMRGYDKMNRVLKMIRFYKPTIIIANDLVQAGLANPKFIGYLPEAFKARDQRFDRTKNADFRDILSRFKEAPMTKERPLELLKFLKENPGYKYNIAHGLNLFNKGVSLGDPVSGTLRTVLDLMGKHWFFGGLVEKFAGKTAWQKIAGSAEYIFRSQQTITWAADEVIRTAVFSSMFDRFIRVHDFDRAAYNAAEWANLFLVKYSRLPMATRQWLNRIFLVPTYRIQTLRMYKEMLRGLGRGVSGLAGKEIAERFKVSDNKFEQAAFEMGPFIRKVAFTATLKTMAAQIFGYTYEDVFDMITGYRAKKRKKGKRGILDDTMEFLSFSTPLFDMEKYFTRVRRAPKVLLRYNAAGLPGLVWMLALNEDLITGKRFRTAPWDKRPDIALVQTGMNVLKQYIPFGTDVYNWSTQDIDFTKHALNFFGISFFYNYKNPMQLLRDFEKTYDPMMTPAERKKTQDKFYYEFRRAYQVLFNEKFKSLFEELDEMKEQMGR